MKITKAIIEGIIILKLEINHLRKLSNVLLSSIATK